MNRYRIIKRHSDFFIQKRRWVPWLWKTYVGMSRYELYWETTTPCPAYGSSCARRYWSVEEAEEDLTRIIKFKVVPDQQAIKEYQ